MEGDSVMSDFATGAGQQEGDSDDHTYAGVRKRPEFSEGVKQKQR